MDYFINLLFSFIATAGFGIIFNAPIKAIPVCGLVGSIGWIIYYTLMQFSMSEVHATFLGAFVVAILAQIFARRFKSPMIVFNIPGIIPLVPGGIAYNTMRSIVELDYSSAVVYGTRVLLISGAIAMGLVFAEVIVQMIYRMLNKGRTSMQSFARNERQKIK
jgi:uncharacterized membrane protein YjjB (DUF3815 family)